MSKSKKLKAGSSRKGAKTTKAARAPRAAKPAGRDPRLPAVGEVIKREYKGGTIRVHVLENGFRCNGQDWRSLSALATKLTGNSTNGFLWFGLAGRKGAAPRAEAPAAKEPKAAKPKVTRTKRAAALPKDAAAQDVAPAAEAATA